MGMVGCVGYREVTDQYQNGGRVMYAIATVKSGNWYRKKQIEQNIFTKIQENSRRQEKHKGGDFI